MDLRDRKDLTNVINVTKTFLPPVEEYEGYLRGIWERGIVTNNGPLVRELELKLKEYLGVRHLFFATNGTIVLQIALKALEITGEVITTPFSYVATTTSILWENCKPVFADIDPSTLGIDPKCIEELITPRTQAILATHVYGVPCEIEAIETIARKNNLKVIYDAAHAFGTVYNGKQLAGYGDISTLSFHATKLFHTIEGGAIITNDDQLADKIALYRSFGHRGDDYFSMGINGKNSEFHAAMGLCMLPRVPEIIEARKKICLLYDDLLKDCGVQRPQLTDATTYNYAYYPVIFPTEQHLLRVKQALQENEIFPRRYFYPSLNKLPYVKDKYSCPQSENFASRVLSLPLYPGLTMQEVELISRIILKAIQ